MTKSLSERTFSVRTKKPSESDSEWAVFKSGLSYEAALVWEAESRAHGFLAIIDDETRAVVS